MATLCRLAAAVARFRGALTDADNSYRRADARASDPRKHSTYAEVGSAADAAQLHEIRPNVVACDRHRNIDTRTVAAMLRTRLRLAPTGRCAARTTLTPPRVQPRHSLRSQAALRLPQTPKTGFASTVSVT